MGATLAERYQWKKCIRVQEQPEEYHEGETQWGLLTIQKSHPPEVHHLKIAGGQKSVWEDPYSLLLLPPTQSSQPLLRAGSASSHHGLDGPLVWPQKPFSVLILCSVLMDYFCYYFFTDPFPCSRPLPFDFSMCNMYYVWRKLNLPCAKAQQQSRSCRMLLVQGLLQTPAVLPLTSVGLKPHPSSRRSLTVVISLLHSPSYFLPALVPRSLGREDTRVRELCEQPALLKPTSQQCWPASGTTCGIQEMSPLGCVRVAPDTSSGGAAARWSGGL